jgi:hypothetical protein
MCNKKIITMHIKDLISTIPFKEMVEEHSYENLQKLSKKLIGIDQNIQYFNIQTIVANIDIAENTMLKESFIDILNKKQFCLLKIIFHKNEIKMKEKTVNITLIEDKKYNPLSYYIFDFLLNLSDILLNGKVNFSNFNQKVEKEYKKLSNCVLGTRKSILKTLYGIEDVKRIRDRKKTNLKKEKQFTSTAVTCICGLKYQINSKNIDLMTSIDERSQNIIFNCLHVDTNFTAGKFFIKKSKYPHLLTDKPTDLNLKHWFIKNFEELKNDYCKNQ